MIRAEYRKVYHLLYEEERRYLERMEKESNEILQQLRASEDSMDQKGKVPRGMYEDLKKTCHEPDVELLQVRTEESHGAAWRTSTISSSTVTRWQWCFVMLWEGFYLSRWCRSPKGILAIHKNPSLKKQVKNNPREYLLLKLSYTFTYWWTAPRSLFEDSGFVCGPGKNEKFQNLYSSFSLSVSVYMIQFAGIGAYPLLGISNEVSTANLAAYTEIFFFCFSLQHFENTLKR